MTDDELVAEVLNVMNASQESCRHIEDTVWQETPDPDRLEPVREEVERTTADWYAVVNICRGTMWNLKDSGDHWNWPAIVQALDATARQQLEAFFVNRRG